MAPKSTLKVIPKKRGRPATGKDPLIALRLPPKMIEAIDKWAAQQQPPMSRSKAVRTMIETALKKGRWASAEGQLSVLQAAFRAEGCRDITARRAWKPHGRGFAARTRAGIGVVGGVDEALDLLSEWGLLRR